MKRVLRIRMMFGVLVSCAIVGPFRMGAMQVDGVAAYVNDHVITMSEVLSSSRTLQEKLREEGGQPEANSIYLKVLDGLIDRKLILDAYDQQTEIQIPPVMIDERVEQIVRELFNDDRNAFLRALGEEGRSEVSWREGIREQVVVQAMRNLRVDRLVHVSPTEVRAHYNTHADQYARDASITYRMLVVNAPPEAGGADEIVSGVQAALAAGEDFADVTRRFSIDQFAEEGGLRGPLQPSELRPELRKNLESMDVDEVTGPVALGTHFIWLQLVSYVPAERKSFSEVQETIEDEIYRARSQQLYRAWLDRLRSDAFVTVAIEKPF